MVSPVGLAFPAVFLTGSPHIFLTALAVFVDGNLSSMFPLSCGVPQGSVIGPIFFNLSTTPLSSVIA